MKREDFESALRTSHGAVRMARVAMRSGGAAYVRRPTVDEYESMQISIDGAEGESKQRGYAAYVQRCFIGALDGDGNEIDFAEVERREGPAFVRGGGLGLAVNALAGSGTPQTTFL